MTDGYSSDTRGQIEPSAPNFTPGALVVAGIVVAALYFGREVFVPFVVAVLLSFVLAIPVRLLQNWGLGRKFPVAIVVLLAFAVILGLGGVLVSQLTQLAGDLPSYQVTIREKISTLKGAAAGSGPLERAADMLQSLSDEISGGNRAPAEPNRSPGASPPTPEKAPPLPVEVVNTRTSPLETVSGYVTPLLHPLATMALVAVFVVFMLLQRSDLRNRLIRLAGSHDLQRTTAALNDAARRLSRFFLMQVLLNSTFGIVVGIGLWLIGVPSPILWGMLAAISRFIPYVGVVLAAGGPLLLAAAVDPGWTMLLTTAAFFAILEFMAGQVVEPLLYGHSTGLSPVAVLLSVTFWTWIWGPVGLLLATPLTVCVVVLGRHVERLEFLEIILGDRPPLTVAESFYQRVLAGDSAEVIEQAEEFLKLHPLASFFDEVAVKGLALAQLDLARGALNEARLERIEETVAALLEDLSDRDTEAASAETGKGDSGKSDNAKGDAARADKRATGDEDLDEELDERDNQAQTLPYLTPENTAPGWSGGDAVLCVAGRNPLDLSCARMLSDVLAQHGLASRVESAEALTSAGILHLPSSAVRIVCISYLDASSPVHVRYAVRRLRRRLPSAQVIVAAWGLSPEQAKTLREAGRADHCATSLTYAAQICLEAATGTSPADTERTDPGEIARPTPSTAVTPSAA